MKHCDHCKTNLISRKRELKVHHYCPNTLCHMWGEVVLTEEITCTHPNLHHIGENSVCEDCGHFIRGEIVSITASEMVVQNIKKHHNDRRESNEHTARKYNIVEVFCNKVIRFIDQYEQRSEYDESLNELEKNALKNKADYMKSILVSV